MKKTAKSLELGSRKVNRK